jgi:tetratricopeptide (TPR) repeat protein
MLLQVPGALGSSFASPLYAGIAALGLTQDELWKYVASYAARVFPLFNNALVDTTMGGVSKAPPEILQEIDQGYWKSVSLLPHVHSEVHSNHLPHVPLTDPAGCPFCGVFADLQLINLGYWLYSMQQPLQALDVLKAARVLCPWSAHAIAFEGSALAMLSRYHEAVKNYEMAVRMRPGYAPYKAALQALQTLAQIGQGKSAPGAEGSPLEFARARHRELRRWNWIYYLVTAGLLALHWSGAAHTVSRWLLLAPALVGLQQAYTCARRTRVADRYFHLVPDLETRRVLKMLGRLLRISRAAFATSAMGLLVFFFFP